MLFTKNISYLKILGITIMCIAVFFNPFVIALFFSPDGSIGSNIVKIVIVLLEVIIFSLGFIFFYFSNWVFSRLREFLLLGVVLFICFLILNTVLSFYSNSRICIEFDKELGWDNAKNCEKIFTDAEYRMLIITNNQTMRESEDFSAKTEKYRIAIVGDSFVWGQGVGEEERFSEILQKQLGDKFEIMNFGVPGYGTDQYLLKMKEVLPFHPDVVIVSFFINDLDNIQYTEQYGKNKPMYIIEEGELKLIGVPVQKKTGFKEDIFRKATIVFALQRKLFPDLSLFIQDIHVEILKKDPSEPVKKSFELNALLYKEMNSIVHEQGIKFVVLHIPTVENYISEDDLQKNFPSLTLNMLDLNKTSNMLYNLSAEMGVPYIDLQLYFYEHGGLNNFFTHDTHLNREGNKNAAQKIYEELLLMNITKNASTLMN